ncbi:MAG: hypothetical protein DLM61_10005 [Pseudonocardiales bacterium]|nr:MAG: hypothetical protein DLM61_10005 [Pseudonocardiales bacterium]
MAPSAGGSLGGVPNKWANPYRPYSAPRPATRPLGPRYRAHLPPRPELVAEARVELAGRDLACWCPAELKCRADVLLELASSTLDN